MGVRFNVYFMFSLGLGCGLGSGSGLGLGLGLGLVVKLVVNWIVLVIVLPSSDSLFTVCVSFTDFLLFVFLPF